MPHGSTAYRTTTAGNGIPSTEIVQEVVELVNNPATSIARLAATVGKDKTLTNMILRKANSSYYGFPGRVTSVNFALVLLGFNALRETLVQTLVSTAFRNLVGALSSYEDLWNHSLATGLLSRALAEKTQRCNPEEALIAGLLHDVGFLVLHQQATTPSGGQSTTDSSLYTRKRNTEVLVETLSHEEAGCEAARRWNLPPAVIEAIRYHHQPQSATIDPALTAVVHLADVLSARMSWGLSEDRSHIILHEDALRSLGLDQSLLSKQSIDGLFVHVTHELSTVPRFEELVSRFRSLLIDEIERMEPTMKVVIALHYVENFSWKEIAQLLHQQEDEVQKIHGNAISYLRRAIEEAFSLQTR